MDGIINVYKEKGYTSHDVVARLRGICRERHIGHTGTLDPAATGVLPICLGWATKVCDMLTDRTKEYETVLLLGLDTDSEDATGTLINKYDVSSITDDMIRAAVGSMVGVIEQVPPMLSAKRVQGQRLYDLARQGIETERKSKQITVNKIEIISEISRQRLSDIKEFNAFPDTALYTYPDNLGDEDGHWHWENDGIFTEKNMDLQVIRLALRINCEKGTYIRTICSDIGKRLGCGGCMERLLRTRVGEFGIDGSIRIEELERIFSGYFSERDTSENQTNDTMPDIILSPDKCFMQYKSYNTKEKHDQVLHNGNLLHFRHFQEYITEPEQIVRVYDSKGHFCGVYEWNAERKLFKPLKMFTGKN